MEQESFVPLKKLVESKILPYEKSALYEMAEKGEIPSYRNPSSKGKPKYMFILSEVREHVRQNWKVGSENTKPQIRPISKLRPVSHGILRIRPKKEKMAS